MNPFCYLNAHLEAAYVASHPELTEAGRALLRRELESHPERYATCDHDRALLSYAQVHRRLHAELARMEDIPDEEFDRRRPQLTGAAQQELRRIWQADPRCYDARTVSAQLGEGPLDSRLGELRALEEEARAALAGALPDFDPDNPRFWSQVFCADWEHGDGAHTGALPELVGWLHLTEALAQECMMSARYRVAERCARTVMRAQGYPTRAAGTLLLALARLEDEDAFFEAVREGGEALERSPWYLLARTLLLYKLGRVRSAKRALRDFIGRCDGSAFFLLNPTYLDPYLPVRPEVGEPWRLTHQAVWEADGIIVDTPDFAGWAASVDGVPEAADAFAQRNGF